MVDVNTFFLILMCVLGSILLVVLIVLVVKLINTVDRLNVVLDDINNRIGKIDNLFHNKFNFPFVLFILYGSILRCLL